MANAEPYLFPSVMLVLTWVGAFLRDPATLNSFFAEKAKVRATRTLLRTPLPVGTFQHWCPASAAIAYPPIDAGVEEGTPSRTAMSHEPARVKSPDPRHGGKPQGEFKLTHTQRIC